MSGLSVSHIPVVNRDNDRKMLSDSLRVERIIWEMMKIGKYNKCYK